MPATLPEVLDALRTHAPELKGRGVRHLSVFGSVARGEARPDSDVDVLVDLDPAEPIGVFEYARLKLDIRDLLGVEVDLADRETLKPLIRDKILSDAVNAF